MLKTIIILIAAFLIGALVIPVIVQAAFPMPLVKLVNGIPMSYNFSTNSYSNEVITPTHLNQTLIG